MYLMYVDESGDVGLINSPSRYFVLIGLVVHELRWQQTREELINFRQALKQQFGFKLREEIHASAMLSKPGALARIPKHSRLEILRRQADKLAALPDLALICIVADKQGKPAGYNVFERAWEALIQRFENTLAKGNFPGPKNPDDRGMLFPDHTDDKKLNALLRRMRVYNPVPNKAAFGAGYYRNLTVRSVIEDANFRDSAHSYFVQAVDVSAFLLYQHLSPSGYMKKKGGQNYFRRLDPIVAKIVSRHADGVVRL